MKQTNLHSQQQKESIRPRLVVFHYFHRIPVSVGGASSSGSSLVFYSKHKHSRFATSCLNNHMYIVCFATTTGE